MNYYVPGGNSGFPFVNEAGECIFIFALFFLRFKSYVMLLWFELLLHHVIAVGVSSQETKVDDFLAEYK